MKMLFMSSILGCSILVSAQQGSATAEGAKSATSPFLGTKLETQRLKFRSRKDWSSGRWFVVGEYSPQQIQWLDREATSLTWNSECLNPPTSLKAVEEISRVGEAGKLEVLRNENYLAIEWDPVEATQDFTLSAKVKGQNCSATIKVSPRWAKAQAGPRPLFFLKPSGNIYYGQSIEVDSVQTAQRADIQMDFTFGYGRLSLPNRDVGRKSPVHLLPLVTARIEWFLPKQNRWALSGTLDQSIYSLGGTANQNVNLSDWSVGAFYQRTQSWFQGFVWRVHAGVHHHLFDDFNVLRSVAFQNREAFYLPVGVSGQFFLGRRWSTGLEIHYAFPNGWAGRGVDQSYLSSIWRTTYRLSSAVLALGEASYRSFMATGLDSENILAAQVGVRLEL